MAGNQKVGPFRRGGVPCRGILSEFRAVCVPTTLVGKPDARRGGSPGAPAKRIALPWSNRVESDIDDLLALLNTPSAARGAVVKSCPSDNKQQFLVRAYPRAPFGHSSLKLRAALFAAWLCVFPKGTQSTIDSV